MPREVFKDGKWEKGTAAPEHLSEELRELPGSYITKDIDDGDHIHELDDPHIVLALKDDLKKEEETEQTPSTEEELERFSVAKLGEVLPFTGLGPDQRQKEVDINRMRVSRMIVNRLYQQAERGEVPNLEVFDRKLYVWFPDDNVNNYTWPEGNPPPDSERPEYLRGLELHIDVLNWPPRIVDYLTKRGVSVPSAQDVYNSLVQVQVVDPLDEPNLDEYAEALHDIQTEDRIIH